MSQNNLKEEDIIEVKIPSKNKQQQDKSDEDIQFLYERKKQPVIQQKYYGPCLVCENQAKYKCPKCQKFYCNTECYRNHSEQCTEIFYQQQVEQQLKSKKADDKETKKMKSILSDYKDMQSSEDVQMQESVEEKQLERLEKLYENIDSIDFGKLNRQEQEQFVQFLKDNQQLEEVIKEWIPFWKTEEGIFSLYVEEIEEQENNILNNKQSEQKQKQDEKDIFDQNIDDKEMTEDQIEQEMVKELDKLDQELEKQVDLNFKDINKSLQKEGIQENKDVEDDDKELQQLKEEYQEYQKKLNDMQQQDNVEQESTQNIENEKDFEQLQKEYNEFQKQNKNNSTEQKIQGNNNDQNQVQNEQPESESDDENISPEQAQIKSHKKFRQKMKKLCKNILNFTQIKKQNSQTITIDSDKQNQQQNNLKLHLVNIIYGLIVSFKYFNGDFHQDELFNFFLGISECIGQSKAQFLQESNALISVQEKSMRLDRDSQFSLQQGLLDIIEVFKNKFFIVEALMHLYDIVHEKMEVLEKRVEDTVQELKEIRASKRKLNMIKNKIIFFLSFIKHLEQEELDKTRVELQNYQADIQKQENIQNDYKKYKKQNLIL